MDKTFQLRIGDVVQLSPQCKNPMFGGCFMVVTELKTFGCQGYVQSLGQDGKMGGQAYYRPTWDEMEWIGAAQWAVGSLAEKPETA